MMVYDLQKSNYILNAIYYNIVLIFKKKATFLFDTNKEVIPEFTFIRYIKNLCQIQLRRTYMGEALV